MNVIKLAIGSGILLLSCGAYSQSISEKTNSDKKGAAEFSPLSVSVGKTTSEQEALEKTARPVPGQRTKTCNHLTQQCVVCLVLILK